MRLRMKIGTAGVALAVMGMAACAPGSSSSSSSDTASGPKTVDFNSFKGKTLTYVYFTDGPDEQAHQGRDRQVRVGDGAKVNLQILPFADLNTSLQARLSAGNAPEVARVADWHVYSDEAVDFKQYFGSDYAKEFSAGAPGPPRCRGPHVCRPERPHHQRPDDQR